MIQHSFVLINWWDSSFRFHSTQQSQSDKVCSAWFSCVVIACGNSLIRRRRTSIWISVLIEASTSSRTFLEKFHMGNLLLQHSNKLLLFFTLFDQLVNLLLFFSENSGKWEEWAWTGMSNQLNPFSSPRATNIMDSTTASLQWTHCFMRLNGTTCQASSTIKWTRNWAFFGIVFHSRNDWGFQHRLRTSPGDEQACWE